MKRLVRGVLSFLAMLALDGGSRSAKARGSRVGTLLDRVRPEPVSDDTVESRVRKRLDRTASDPSAIVVSIEHGCVDLRGPVETRERARIVKAVATVPGVDSVLDLMTEPHAAQGAAAVVRPPAPRGALARAAHAVRPRRWRAALGILAGIAGIGSAIAVLSLSRARW